ncbi:MAG TPA: hypothetical protein VFZ97_10285 [Acidimicrobiales bacterium]
MRTRDLLAAGSVASAHHRKIRARGDAVEVGVLVIRLVSVGLLAAVGWIHLHLWEVGYRHIATIGPLFLATTIGAFVLAAGLLLRPSRLLGFLGIALLAGILGGLVVSVNAGLFGFTESLSAPFAVESIVLEAVGALSLAAWIGLDLFQESRLWRRFWEDPRTSPDVGGRVITTFVSRPHANIEN